jgi:assimilatory nitrate reductase catalytic subunit
MVTNSDRTISRQRTFLPAPGEAARIGASSATWRVPWDSRASTFVSPHEIFREHAQLTAHANDGRRLLNLGAWASISAVEYKNWEPSLWLCPNRVNRRTARCLSAENFALRWARASCRSRRACPNPASKEFRWCSTRAGCAITGTSMTRTGKSARLSAHVAEPYAEINTADALRFAVREGSLATLRSDWGSMVVRVRTGSDIPSGMVFAPIHWNRAYASDARVGALTNPVVDPVSGEPELKHTPVSIEHFTADWYGVMLTRKPLPPPGTKWWTKVQGEQFTCALRTCGNSPADWAAGGASLVRCAAGRWHSR